MTTTTRRIAIYARVSSAEQARADATSIQKQIDAGRREAERLRGFGDDVEIIKEYADEGVTGASSFEDRPAGFQLLIDAKRGKFDTVVFFSLDRFTRNATRGLADFEMMEDGLGLNLIFAKENIDTRQASGKLFRTILAAFAEFERDTIRDRNMAGRYGKAKKGHGWATGMAPFGFQIGPDGNLIEQPEEAEIVRTIFMMRANGASMPVIARALNDSGATPRERKDAKTGEPIPQSFSPGSVNGYLKNTAYKGDPIVRRIRPSKNQPPEEFEFPVPEIVSPAIWRKANATAAKPVEGAGEKRNLYALANRIYHVHQDGATETLYGSARKTGKKGQTRFYRCSASRERPGKPPTCDGMGEAYGHELTSAQADWIESQALLWILDMVSSPQAAEKLLRETDEVGDTEIAYERLKGRQNDLTARRSRWVEQYADGVIDRATRDEHTAAIEAELEVIEREIARLQQQEAHFATASRTLDELMTMPVIEGGSDPQRHEAPEIGSAEWWEMARVAAAKSSVQGKYGRFAALPSWLVEDIKVLAERLDVKVYLTRNDENPREPQYYVGFAPPPYAHTLDGGAAHQETYKLETLDAVTESQETREGSYPPSTLRTGRVSTVALPTGNGVAYFEGRQAGNGDRPPDEKIETIKPIPAEETLKS